MALDPAQSPGFLLWHATLRWQRAVTAALTPLELTHVQFVLLACTWWLNGRGGQPSQIEVAAQAGTDAQLTSQVLRSLEAKGLLERAPDPDDARARRLLVTPAGATVAQRAISVVEEVDREVFETVRATRRCNCSRRWRASPTGTPRPRAAKPGTASRARKPPAPAAGA